MKANFGEDVVLAHVECHNHPDFCHGLTRKDSHTVVAYRMISGPLIELSTDEDVKKAKKGDYF
ncbi:hypothetical protein OESDEN_11516 [Oesophagostomum dentatum]|uniref:Uncharacterized protein n=1 Tax=Oesophagostomum dentatum TaxID=61180 RepID=A0A0B1SYX2_OESDE|nr:hypothetical protein OESDEN_11516 [Oesophagostomum dentatum]